MLAAEHLDRHVGLGENAVIGGGVPGKFFGLSPEQHANAVAAQVKMPGDDEAVAGVVPAAATDDDRPGDAQSAKHVGHAAAGVLHQHQPRETELLDGDLIDPARLLASEGERQHGKVLGTRRVPFLVPCRYFP